MGFPIRIEQGAIFDIRTQQTLVPGAAGPYEVHLDGGQGGHFAMGFLTEQIQAVGRPDADLAFSLIHVQLLGGGDGIVLADQIQAEDGRVRGAEILLAHVPVGFQTCIARFESSMAGLLAIFCAGFAQ